MVDKDSDQIPGGVICSQVVSITANCANDLPPSGPDLAPLSPMLWHLDYAEFGIWTAQGLITTTLGGDLWLLKT